MRYYSIRYVVFVCVCLVYEGSLSGCRIKINGFRISDCAVNSNGKLPRYDISNAGREISLLSDEERGISHILYRNHDSVSRNKARHIPISEQ